MTNSHYLNNIYNQLHEIPEVGYEEIKTSALLAKSLEEMGYEVQRAGETGLIGVLDSNISGKTIAVRADIDALEYEIDGKKVRIHACGHDANMAMVLSTAKLIKENGIEKGCIKFVFQPAEEKGSGALSIIETGLIDDIEEMIGIHLRASTELKLGEASPAVIHGGIAKVKVTIKGVSSHGAWPNMGINAVDAGVLVVNAINAIRVDPRVSHSAKVTQFNTGGDAFNIIPDHVELLIDIRAQENYVLEEMLKKIKPAIEFAAKSIGAEAAVEVPNLLYAATKNDAMILDAGKAITKILGNTREPLITPGSDDFHNYAIKLGVKSTLIGLGANLEPVLHHPEMKFDLKALENGRDILVELIQLRLKN